MECDHPDGTALYPATDDEGNDVIVFRCADCGTAETYLQRHETFRETFSRISAEKS